MSLYGRTDSNANKTKAGLAAVSDSNTRTIVFVDNTEAQLEENKSRGITSPGWWAYDTYTDMHGNTRHKCELLVFIADPDGTETQADDTIAADVASAVTITVQPANSTSSSGAGTYTLTTTTTGTPGALAYVWQRQLAGEDQNWTDIVGGAGGLDTGITYADFTTATLAYSALASNALDGTKFRVKITSAGGTEEVISDGAATLTFGS
tara:strand:+ start:1322 stop:1945 length:624 start_codon:yes stop_codon:yes gene_type:complete